MGNISLAHLKEVSFGPVSGSDANADLLLKSGKRVQLKVNKSILFYGDLGSGAYHIAADDVSRIVFIRDPLGGAFDQINVSQLLQAASRPPVLLGPEGRRGGITVIVTAELPVSWLRFDV